MILEMGRFPYQDEAVVELKTKKRSSHTRISENSNLNVMLDDFFSQWATLFVETLHQWSSEFPQSRGHNRWNHDYRDP